MKAGILIGISGKISSGKDTFAGFLKNQIDWGNRVHGGAYAAQIVRFADTLKDIVCMLTGCTRAMLEDQAFKNSPLPAEWSRWQEKVDNGVFSSGQYVYTYREALQIIGTELLRNQFHPNTHVNATFSRYKANIVTKFKNWGGEAGELESGGVYPNWIIPDVRFPNEADAIKQRGGLLFRIERKGLTSDVHLSETALDSYEGFDELIYNNGDLTDLRRFAADTVNKFNLK